MQYFCVSGLAIELEAVNCQDTLVSYRRHEQQATKQRHFWFQHYRAKLRGLTAIQGVVQTFPDENLKRLFKWVLGESYLQAAWAARQMGDYADARRTAIAALALRPTSPRVWRSLATALIPRRREPVT